MSEEMIDIPVELDAETTAKLNAMTKKELIEKICAVSLEAKVSHMRCVIAIEDSDKAFKEIETLKERLDKAETYVEQGRAMINALMDRWYHYD